MAITIDKPIILAKKQTYKFSTGSITKTPAGMEATIIFNILNESGVVVDNKSLTLTGNDYNNFWKAFTSGTYLYQMLAKALGLPNSQIPGAGTLESEFVNPTT